MKQRPRIIVLGYSEAAMYLRDHASDVAAVLSIHGQREHPVECIGIEQLVLYFDDSEPPDTADPLSAARLRRKQREAAAVGLQLKPPDISDARAIVTFARKHAATSGAVLLHCHAGISRSTAAALICLATWSGPGREREDVALLRALRPAAVPMRGLVRMGDDLLERGGALVDALES